MKNVSKLVLTAVVCVGLTACASKEPMTTEEPQEPAPRTETPRVETAPVIDPRDYANPDNLTNEDSLLSKRVIYFDFDKSEVLPEYRDIVAAHAAYLASSGSARVTLESHADERGTREYNLGLGERRSNAVSNVLDVQGAAGNQLTTVSYGEERPVATCSEERCWERNRRVEIVYTRN